MSSGPRPSSPRQLDRDSFSAVALRRIPRALRCQPAFASSDSLSHALASFLTLSRETRIALARSRALGTTELADPEHADRQNCQYPPPPFQIVIENCLQADGFLWQGTYVRLPCAYLRGKGVSVERASFGLPQLEPQFSPAPQSAAGRHARVFFVRAAKNAHRRRRTAGQPRQLRRRMPIAGGTPRNARAA